MQQTQENQYMWIITFLIFIMIVVSGYFATAVLTDLVSIEWLNNVPF